MRRNHNHDPGKEFPLREQIEDFSGKVRSFVITCHEGGLGFTLRAKEEGVEDGYEFGAYTETSPYSALGRLRDKMAHALATRHLAGAPGEYHMTHDMLRGRIASDGEQGVVLVVDGRPLDLDDFAAILTSHEGWGFELHIVDPLE